MFENNEPPTSDYIAAEWRAPREYQDFYTTPEEVEQEYGYNGWWVRFSAPVRENGVPYAEPERGWFLRAFRTDCPVYVEWFGAAGHPERGSRVIVGGLERLEESADPLPVLTLAATGVKLLQQIRQRPRDNGRLMYKTDAAWRTAVRMRFATVLGELRHAPQRMNDSRLAELFGFDRGTISAYRERYQTVDLDVEYEAYALELARRRSRN